MLEIYVVSSLLCLFVPSFDCVFVVGLFVVGSFGWLFLCYFVSSSLVCVLVRLITCLFACLSILLLVFVFVRGCGAGGDP